MVLGSPCNLPAVESILLSCDHSFYLGCPYSKLRLSGPTLPPWSCIIGTPGQNMVNQGGGLFQVINCTCICLYLWQPLFHLQQGRRRRSDVSGECRTTFLAKYAFRCVVFFSFRLILVFAYL